MAKPIVLIHRVMKYHRAWAQDVANVTNVPTDLYLDQAGQPRLVIEGWPLEGMTLIGTFMPTTRSAHQVVKP